MSFLTFHHPPRPTNGAPQVVATFFAAMVFFMMLLPLVQISVDGISEPWFLIQLLNTDAGFNIAALILLLVPVIGIADAMLTPWAWRGVTTSVAGVALLTIPLMLLWLRHSIHDITTGFASATFGVGSYVLLVGYSILAVTTGVAAFRAHHH